MGGGSRVTERPAHCTPLLHQLKLLRVLPKHDLPSDLPFDDLSSDDPSSDDPPLMTSPLMTSSMMTKPPSDDPPSKSHS